MTRVVGLVFSKGKPMPQGLPEKLVDAVEALERRLGRGSVSGRVLWCRGVCSRLLCGLLELREVIFPASANLAKSFSTSGKNKMTSQVKIKMLHLQNPANPKILGLH